MPSWSAFRSEVAEQVRQRMETPHQDLPLNQRMLAIMEQIYDHLEGKVRCCDDTTYSKDDPNHCLYHTTYWEGDPGIEWSTDVLLLCRDMFHSVSASLSEDLSSVFFCPTFESVDIAGGALSPAELNAITLAMQRAVYLRHEQLNVAR